MTQGFVTVAIPFQADRADRVEACLGTLGNPAGGAIAEALDRGEFVHFISMMVVRRPDEVEAHLLLEASVDGDARTGLALIATTIESYLVGVLRAADLSTWAPLAAYLEKYRLDVLPGWFSTSGVVFAGTPGMTVARIRREAMLAFTVRQWLECNRDREPALKKLEGARTEVFLDPTLKWALFAEPVPLLGGAGTVTAAFRPVLCSLLRNLLWPILIIPLIIALLAPFVLTVLEVVHELGSRLGFQVLWAETWQHHLPGFYTGLERVGIGLLVFFVEVVVVILAGIWLYFHLRASERAEVPKDIEPDAAAVGKLMDRENRIPQNHLSGVSVIKPGFVRRVALRVVFWATGALAESYWRPGFLFSIGSIHFARWLVLPKTNALVFLSNYDGSWESYLEDFIVRAHQGLTAIWSNTVDFPKTSNLIDGGASDGERFKRWARRQQQLTGFWYSAYPDLTTNRIRKNAAIRHGLASATTERDAASWLSNLGFPMPLGTAPTAMPTSRVTPPLPIMAIKKSDDVPTLVFGGLPRLRHARCLIVKLQGIGPLVGRDWLCAISEEISYGERVWPDSALVVGFTATGLRKIGLASALETFPTAFQHGMSAPWRSRALGDTDANSPDNWLWGGPHCEVDAIVLLYARSKDRLDENVERHRALLDQYGHTPIREIKLSELPAGSEPLREPFGFIDGISQPIIRGTRRWETQQRSAIHGVEPGELILGCTDNLGFIAPTPHWKKSFDVGRNGTYLVARQLEQSKDRFDAYLDQVAAQVAMDPRSPSTDPVWLREWIEAKIVGRWREDGTSLVRYPTAPGTRTLITDEPDNDFLFGAEDPDGLRCPLGAHIRRLNPRESFDPASQVQLDITNRHRILRVGRKYDPHRDLEKPGLLFLCVNSDFERQFEFLQQTWALGRDFHSLGNESDFMLDHQRPAGAPAHGIPTPYGLIRIARMSDFVLVRGGGYFFMPSRRTVCRLLIRTRTRIRCDLDRTG